MLKLDQSLAIVKAVMDALFDIKLLMMPSVNAAPLVYANSNSNVVFPVVTGSANAANSVVVRFP